MNMPASYPGSAKSWSNKQDNIDDVFAGDINGAYEEIIAVENELIQVGDKRSAKVATTQNGDLATAYANGQTVDGIVLATGDRILIKDQTNGAENGIYTVNASGAPTRAADANTAAHMVAGLKIYVREGTVNAKGTWRLTTTGTITLGTTPLTFENKIAAHLADNTTAHGVGNKLDKTGGDMTGEIGLKTYTEVLGTVPATTGTVTLDLSTGNTFNLTPTGAVTIAISNPPESGKVGSFTLQINMPATLYAVTFPASFKWDGDVIPTFTASKTAVITGYTLDGGVTYRVGAFGTKFTT